MSNEDLITAISLLTFSLFMVSLTLVLFKQVDRILRIRRAGEAVPPALKRDTLWWLFVSIIILVPLANTVITGGNLSSNLWWVITRSIAALVAIWIWLYYEFYGINKVKK
jgi:hypothetical protein